MYKKVGQVIAFPNPSYIDPNSKEVVYHLPWYMFVVVRDEIDCKLWEEKENFLYFFLRDRTGNLLEVDHSDFRKFLSTCQSRTRLKQSQVNEDFVGQLVRVERGLFTGYQGVVEKVEGPKLAVRITTSNISMLVWLKGQDLVVVG